MSGIENQNKSRPILGGTLHDVNLVTQLDVKVVRYNEVCGSH